MKVTTIHKTVALPPIALSGYFPNETVDIIYWFHLPVPRFYIDRYQQSFSVYIDWVGVWPKEKKITIIKYVTE